MASWRERGAAGGQWRAGAGLRLPRPAGAGERTRSYSTVRTVMKCAVIVMKRAGTVICSTRVMAPVRRRPREAHDTEARLPDEAPPAKPDDHESSWFKPREGSVPLIRGPPQLQASRARPSLFEQVSE